jgi:hypothetical protein
LVPWPKLKSKIGQIQLLVNLVNLKFGQKCESPIVDEKEEEKEEKKRTNWIRPVNDYKPFFVAIDAPP